MKPTAAIAALAAAVLLLTGVADAAAPMWDAFVPGTSWAMRSSTDGNLTRFYAIPLTHWGCWRGTLIDLMDVKRSPNDYWGIGTNVVGNQIEYRDPNGSWRMVGTYTRSTDRSLEWTMQVHGYRGWPTPYVIAPAHRVDSDTRTQYRMFYSTGIVSHCMRGATHAPAWGQHVYWRSRFRFGPHGWLHAHYEENQGCGPLACQIENWTFAPTQSGMARIRDMRGGGYPVRLTLARRTTAPEPKASGWMPLPTRKTP